MKTLTAPSEIRLHLMHVTYVHLLYRRLKIMIFAFAYFFRLKNLLSSHKCYIQQPPTPGSKHGPCPHYMGWDRGSFVKKYIIEFALEKNIIIELRSLEHH